MNASERANLHFSIEDAASRAVDVAGPSAVQEVFALFGASSFDDLSDEQLDQMFSELARLAAD